MGPSGLKGKMPPKPLNPRLDPAQICLAVIKLVVAAGFQVHRNDGVWVLRDISPQLKRGSWGIMGISKEKILIRIIHILIKLLTIVAVARSYENTLLLTAVTKSHDPSSTVEVLVKGSF